MCNYIPEFTTCDVYLPHNKTAIPVILICPNDLDILKNDIL